MTRGRPFQPGNKFGRGRPRGSRNKTTLLAQELLNGHMQPVIAKVLAMALQGDATAMRLVMDRILPIRREPVLLKLSDLPTRTAGDVSRASERVLEQVMEGKLSVAEAHGLTELLEKRRRAIETEEIEQRLRALENNYEHS